MRVRDFRNSVVGVLMICLAWSAGAADGGRVLRSVVFPGMGQLGDGQTVKGLLYMGGGVALLSMTIGQVASKTASDRDTEYLRVQWDNATSYEEKVEIREEWDQAIENSERAQLLSLAFGGGAAVWWVWNVLDAAIFAPKKSEDQTLIRRIRDNTLVAVGKDEAQVIYRVSF
jgi:hypothetical protein